MTKKKFENNSVFLNEIPEFEKNESTKLEKDYVKVIYANIFIIFSLLTIGALIATLSFDLYAKGIFFIIWIISYLVFWILIFIYYIASFKKRSYNFRDHDVVYRY